MNDRRANTNNSAPQTEKSPGSSRIVWRRLRRDRLAMISLYIIVILFLISCLAPVVANNKPLWMRWNDRDYFPAVVDLFPLKHIVKYRSLQSMDFSELRDDASVRRVMPPVPYSPFETNLREKLSHPSRRHWMGTDDLGRDVCSRMFHGTGVSLKVGFVAVGIALLIGLLFGSLAGYYGGAVDIVISRFIEIVMCFPFFFLILSVIAFLPPSIYNIMIVIGITRWTSIARYARGEFLKVKKQDYTQAARALGVSDRKIIFRHILPNSIAPVLVTATFGIANAILIEAALSFLGMGIQPPYASWGGILALAREFIDVAWWLATFPGLAIFVTVTAYNLTGEGFRDATDPRLSLPEK
ncbi:MAG: ABC transporter permease [Candidatus Latescibacterota bacterium]|nr:MAG: ABC transporter permease [Candidatus Latescibacterota bacterium]